jgi:hypothetical protein
MKEEAMYSYNEINSASRHFETVSYARTKLYGQSSQKRPMSDSNCGDSLRKFSPDLQSQPDSECSNIFAIARAIFDTTSDVLFWYF